MIFEKYDGLSLQEHLYLGLTVMLVNILTSFLPNHCSTIQTGLAQTATIHCQARYSTIQVNTLPRPGTSTICIHTLPVQVKYDSIYTLPDQVKYGLYLLTVRPGTVQSASTHCPARYSTIYVHTLRVQVKYDSFYTLPGQVKYGLYLLTVRLGTLRSASTHCPARYNTFSIHRLTGQVQYLPFQVKYSHGSGFKSKPWFSHTGEMS